MNTNTDLQLLYNMLNVDVNDPMEIPFSPSEQDSSLCPISIEEGNQSMGLDDKESSSSKTKKRVKYAYGDGQNTYAYEAHPSIKDKDNHGKKHKCKGCHKESCKHCGAHNKHSWSLMTQVYVGSITVVGLYALFRVLQKSR